MAGGQVVRGRFTTVTGRLSDHASAGKAAAVEQERGQARSVVPSTSLVDLGSASHFTTGDEHDLVLQSTGFEIADKSCHGMVEGGTNSLHSIGHVEIVAVRVHVPDGNGKFLMTIPLSSAEGSKASRINLTLFSFRTVSVIIRRFVLAKTAGGNMSLKAVNSAAASSALISSSAKMHFTTSWSVNLSSCSGATSFASTSNYCRLRGSPRLISESSLPLRTSVYPWASRNRLIRSIAS